MVEKRLGWKWSEFWMGSEIQKPNHLISWQMAAILSKTIWNLDKKCPDFEWSVFQMVGTTSIAQPFENRTIWNPTFKSPDFKCFQISNGQISNNHCIQGNSNSLALTIRIPDSPDSRRSPLLDNDLFKPDDVATAEVAELAGCTVVAIGHWSEKFWNENGPSLITVTALGAINKWRHKSSGTGYVILWS